MTLSTIGAAIQINDLASLRDWLFDADRPIEIQDFVGADVIAGDTSDLVARYLTALDGHAGPRGIHGPFFGLDLSNPDRDIRAVIQKRLITGIEIAARLNADMMVIHSPFTFWHALNYTNYGFLREALMDACTQCLVPVLDRAATEGVTLVLENIDDTAPGDRFDLVARLAHPQLKLSVDTGHADLAHHNYGAPPVVDVLAHAGNFLAHVHLQDVDGHADRHWHPGDGRINWRPVMQQLADAATPARLLLEVRHHQAGIPKTAQWLTALTR
ncbi:MAG: sugar phosphate isomerase/epimerase [Loktanella sp.]|nr:sugar phosphate isomerase/epimerase [Loktanella sp.]